MLISQVPKCNISGVFVAFSLLCASEEEKEGGDNSVVVLVAAD